MRRLWYIITMKHFGHCSDPLDDWNTERYVAFTRAYGRSPLTTKEMLTALEALLDWERVHPLEQYTRRSSRSAAMCSLPFGATQKAIAFWNGEKYKQDRQVEGSSAQSGRTCLRMPLAASVR